MVNTLQGPLAVAIMDSNPCRPVGSSCFFAIMFSDILSIFIDRGIMHLSVEV